MDVVDGGSGAVLDRERYVVSFASQVEVGVAPGVEFRGAAQGLAGAQVRGPLSCVVGEQDGGLTGAGESSQEVEDGGDDVGVMRQAAERIDRLSPATGPCSVPVATVPLQCH